MTYNFASLKAKIQEIEAWLIKEHGGIRTGRATPALLDNVTVESYGAKMPLSHVATISILDAKTLSIAPWDASMIKGIESAITAANLGVSTTPDSKSVRVVFPELTSDRRKMLLKLASEKLEEARISLRAEREKTWNDIQTKEKEGGMSEDEKFRYKDELQKHIDEGGKRLEELHEKKRKEIES